jgi:hypothetical protein
VELLYGASVLCSERSFIPTSRTRFDPYIEGRGHACSASISELELFDSKHTSNSASATETDRDAHA